MSKNTLHIYTRVSSDSQEDNTSLQNQRLRGERLAQILGMNFEVWNEGPASSSKEDLENRPVLTELMNAITTGGVKHLYAEYQDRLSRNAKTYGAIRYALRDNNVLFYSQDDPTPVDLSDPTDELIFGVLSEIAQFENRLRTNRFAQGKFQRVKEGKWQGGPPPFGYKIQNKLLVENVDESPWVVAIHEQFADGKTTRQIQDYLRNNGVLTRRKNIEWSLGSIEKLLTNTHYSGYYTVTRKSTNETFRNECPQLISKQLKQKVHDRLAKRSNKARMANPNQRHFYLLTDFLYCGECGRKYRGRTTPRHNEAIYYCPSRNEEWRRREGVTEKCAGVRSVKIPITNRVVWNAVVEVLSKSTLFKEAIKNAELQTGNYELSVREIAKTKRAIREIEKKIEKHTESIGMLKADVLVGDNTDEILATVKRLELNRERLQADKTATSKALEETERGRRWIDWVSAFSDQITELESLSDIRQQHKFLSEIVESIEVHGTDENPTTATLKLNFALPYVDDGLSYIDESNKRKGYEVVAGVKTKTIDYECKKNI